jgi:glycosyltransferase involved in cell wall biosynthesis
MATAVRTIAICAFQTLFARGGSALHIDALRRELSARGHPVEVVQLPFSWTKPDLLPQVLVWRLMKVQADLVIGTNFPSYFVKHDNKVIWLLHQHRPLYELYGTPFGDFGGDSADAEIREQMVTADTRAISEARRVFTTSRNVARRLQTYNGIVGEPLYHPPPLYRALACDAYGDFVLMPTRLQAHKRPELLIEALRLCRSGIKGVLVGSGSMEGELRRRVEKYGLEDRIAFEGFVDDGRLLELYARCRAVLYPPFDEDYGYVTLEAFLAGKPVITTVDAGGVLEFVADGATGLVTAPTPEAIAVAIDRLAESEALCRRMGEAGREIAREISWDNVIRRLLGESA